MTLLSRTTTLCDIFTCINQQTERGATACLLRSKFSLQERVLHSGRVEVLSDSLLLSNATNPEKASAVNSSLGLVLDHPSHLMRYNESHF